MTYSVMRCMPELMQNGLRVFVQEDVPKGTFLFEYKSKEVYPRKLRQLKEEEYSLNDEPCMILEVETPQGWFCLGATRHFNTLGRLINHAPRQQATTKPTKPLFIKGKWRVGFVANRDLKKGEELTWDYGCPPQGQPWLMKYSKVWRF